MSKDTKAKDGRPSEYVIVYVSRRAAETTEQAMAVMPPTGAQTAMLRALRDALKKQAGGKRYPWQVTP